jgi:hypothetical protein
MPGIAALRAISLGAYLRNVEQNDCKKIYCAKTPRRKGAKLRIYFEFSELGVFAPLRE